MEIHQIAIYGALCLVTGFMLGRHSIKERIKKLQDLLIEANYVLSLCAKQLAKNEKEKEQLKKENNSLSAEDNDNHVPHID